MEVGIKEYLSDIENLIDKGNINVAISHCKHILRKYPKYIDVYRLLGKAFLENQFYKEALDIFTRILSVFPDDFVSLLGLSIISEENKDLDGAIWYMDRAYEIQPSNSAIKNELKRLYGIRDGVEPSNIYLSKGVLVRMYAKGKLFPQAIAEAQAALEEDPKRIDLEVLLADLYYQSGEDSKALEIAERIIEKTPYNYTAHYILADLLDKTSQTKEANYHQQTVIALDPYKSIKSFQFTRDENNDFIESLMIDRLENTKADIEITHQTKSALEDIPESVIHLEDQSHPYETYMPDIEDTLNVGEAINEPDGFATEEKPYEGDSDADHQTIPDWLQQITEAGSEEDEAETETEKINPFDENKDLSSDDQTEEFLSRKQVFTDASFLEQDKTETLPIEEEDQSPIYSEQVFTTEMDSLEPDDKESLENINENTPFTPPFIQESSEGIYNDPFAGDKNKNEKKEDQVEETNDWLDRIKDLDNIGDEKEDIGISIDEQNLASLFASESQDSLHDNLYEGLKDDTDEIQNDDIDSKIEWLESLNIDNALKDSPIISPPENQTVVPQDWLEQHISNNIDDTIPSTSDGETTSDIEDKVLDSINKEIDIESSVTEDTPIQAEEEEDDDEKGDIPKLSDLEASSFEEERINTIINEPSEWIKNEVVDSEDDLINDNKSYIAETEGIETETLKTSIEDNKNDIKKTKMDTEFNTGGLTLSEWLSIAENNDEEISPISEVQKEVKSEVQDEIQDEIQEKEDLIEDNATISLSTEEFETPILGEESEYQEEVQSEVQEKVKDEIHDETHDKEDLIKKNTTVSLPTEKFKDMIQSDESDYQDEISQYKEPGIVEAEQIDDPLSLARSALQNNDLGKAIHQYYELIETPGNVEEIIHDLNAVTSMYSTNFSYWQLLGDIYVKNNRLQDALDAYTEAERLLN